MEQKTVTVELQFANGKAVISGVLAVNIRLDTPARQYEPMQQHVTLGPTNLAPSHPKPDRFAAILTSKGLGNNVKTQDPNEKASEQNLKAFWNYAQIRSISRGVINKMSAAMGIKSIKKEATYGQLREILSMLEEMNEDDPELNEPDYQGM